MLDSVIAISLGVLLVEMARFGGQVSANPPTTPAIAKRYTFRFWVYAAFACALVVVQGVRIYTTGKENDTAKAKLNNSISDLNGQLQRSENDRKVDNAYLKAKLEDYKSLEDLAPSLLQLAQATEGYTQKQYETKKLSDANLLALAGSVIEKTRKLGDECAKRKNAASYSYLDEQRPANWRTMTQDQQSDWGHQTFQQEMKQELSVQTACETAYRSQILGDASYVRYELTERLGSPPSETSRFAAALDGMFTGPDPIDDSANYLHDLANDFAVKKGLKPLP